MKKLWKPIPGWGDLYEVSNFGEVKSLPRIRKVNNRWGEFPRSRKGKIMVGFKAGRGYRCVQLKDSPETKTIYIHQIVALLFVPNPNNKPQVNHIDGIKLNNIYSNLEWVTNQENRTHAQKLGLLRGRYSK